MASTAAALKGSMVFAVCVVLLHSSMGQQPDPAPAVPASSQQDCGNSCMSSCNQRCQPISVAEAGQCKTTAELYDDCFKGCTSGCKGNSYARGSCDMGSCSPSSCGSPCGRDCCKNCTATATADPDQFIKCKSSQGMVMISCMSPCMDDCTNNCLNGSVPVPPAP